MQKLYSGCYRTSPPNSTAFGHIKRQDKLWLAEIHKSETGDLIRFAGLWSTLKDAEEECIHLITRDYRAEDVA